MTLPLYDLNLHNETLYAVAAIVIIIAGIIYILGARPWR